MAANNNNNGDGNNTIKIDLTNVKAASFSLTFNGEDVGEVKFSDENPDSHTVEIHREDDKLCVKVVSRDNIAGEQQDPFHAEGDGSTGISIKREERWREVEVEVEVEQDDDSILLIVGGDGPLGEVRLGELGLSPTRKLPKKEEDADRGGVDMSITPWTPPEEHDEDILLIVGEGGLARKMRPEELDLDLPPTRTQRIKEEVADRGIVAPLIPTGDIDVAAAPPLDADAEADAATDTAVHKHDTRYQRRERQQREHRDSLPPSRFHSRPYVHHQSAVPPRQRRRLQRVAWAALERLGGE
jgi:hypothetical protein